MILNFGAAKVLFAVFSIISVVLMPASIYCFIIPSLTSDKVNCGVNEQLLQHVR